MDDSRKASPEIIALYDAEMAQFQIPRESNNGDELPEEIGGVKLADMPGPEALSQPGKRDGQTMMVLDGKLVLDRAGEKIDSITEGKMIDF